MADLEVKVVVVDNLPDVQDNHENDDELHEEALADSGHSGKPLQSLLALIEVFDVPFLQLLVFDSVELLGVFRVSSDVELGLCAQCRTSAVVASSWSRPSAPSIHLRPL